MFRCKYLSIESLLSSFSFCVVCPRRTGRNYFDFSVLQWMISPARHWSSSSLVEFSGGLHRNCISLTSWTRERRYWNTRSALKPHLSFGSTSKTRLSPSKSKKIRIAAKMTEEMPDTLKHYKVPKIEDMPSLGLPIENAKRAAAYLAVDENLDIFHHRIIGVGSGSTVIYVAERLGQYLKDEKFRDYVSQFICIATGFQSKQLIMDSGLQYGIIEQHPVIDIVFDGADEVDPNLQLIKGGGACLFQEKLISTSAKTFIVVADSSKRAPSKLGSHWRKGVPIEVVPPAYVRVRNDLLTKVNAKTAVLREGGKAKAGPIVTDNSNFIIDADFGEIEDPKTLYKEIKLMVGVVEAGIFVDNAAKAYFGNADGSVEILDKQGSAARITSV